MLSIPCQSIPKTHTELETETEETAARVCAVESAKLTSDAVRNGNGLIPADGGPGPGPGFVLLQTIGGRRKTRAEIHYGIPLAWKNQVVVGGEKQQK